MRDQLGAEADKRGDRGDKSDDGNCFSHVSDMNAYLDADNKNENDVGFDVHNIYQRPNGGSFCDGWKAKMKRSLQSPSIYACD